MDDETGGGARPPDERTHATGPQAGPQASAASGGGAAPGVPRWVKVSGTAALALILLFLVLHLTGGGMGPGMHGGGH